MSIEIVGNGMMARAASVMRANLPVTIFASGVSNSNEKDVSAYRREINLLERSISDNALFVYFSSYLAEDGDSKYARHKRNVETIVKQTATRYIILRLPQVVGITGNNTLMNYFVKAITREEPVLLQKHAYRSLIDVVDVMRVLQLLIDKNDINLTLAVGPEQPINVIEIFKLVEEAIGCLTRYKEIDTGSKQFANLSELKKILGNKDVLFDDQYQKRVIEKYAMELFHLNQINFQNQKNASAKNTKIQKLFSDKLEGEL
ncbi:NAD dependent epimerase/dehydratase family protein [Methylophaga frappieri]|uniref:NAD dependent epimerase/dehydratase family protein n=1 Tax=Methylophaga frappieri (strain ATCC BAA-2434 / DSM 25690 / JAM7) TaxID=754477 RepID=I1YG61_METFJ|nr:NAD-dependent epimerase/dehydratase family protein [Methylophaga frappieri]AFJ01904.1 NAD dependent epimerase/dehydratase family protein [Methylophaga frappieri]